jgi:hypothetical protein
LSNNAVSAEKSSRTSGGISLASKLSLATRNGSSKPGSRASYSFHVLSIESRKVVSVARGLDLSGGSRGFSVDEEAPGDAPARIAPTITSHLMRPPILRTLSVIHHLFGQVRFDPAFLAPRRLSTKETGM